MNSIRSNSGILSTAKERKSGVLPKGFCFTSLLRLTKESGPETGRYRFAYAEMFDTERGFVAVENLEKGDGKPIELFCRHSIQEEDVTLFGPLGGTPVDPEAEMIARKEFLDMQENFLNSRR